MSEDTNTYVIEMVGHGLVKIGRTRDLSARLSQLQVACPYELRVFAWLAGDMESQLHSWMEPYRIRGEWFWFGPEIRRVVDLLDKVPIGGEG